jgi:CRISPR system Cascade subunit CasA
MNLINDAWIPIRRESGKHELIAPWQLTETDDPVVALNAPRPDFNGALMQFLIGLLQTAATPDDEHKWLDWLEEPPAAEVLKEDFSQYAYAFELSSEKGSFMQDFEPLEVTSASDLAELLIDSPGGNTVKLNKDHFVKRERVEQVCPSCAATALFSLQSNAPAGGQGHRTSLRGGGPLTTLVILDGNSDLPNDLWRTLWLNVLEQQQIDAMSGDEHKMDSTDIFPWLAKTRTSEKNTGIKTTPIDTHPFQMYWAMPRRIRILWELFQSGCCDLCGMESEHLVTKYQTKNFGINYTGAWQHPLSSYSLNKTGELLPQHAQPGGLTYQHWLGFFEDSENHFSAAVVKRYRKLADQWGEQFLLYAFGYDMDNMKARCWYESTFPLFTIPDDIRVEFSKRVQTLTETAAQIAGFIRSCVKEAWFKRPGDAKGDMSFLALSFYQHTEGDFYQAAKALQHQLKDGSDREVLQQWHKTMRKAAFDSFDYWVTRGDFTQANPRRIAAARNKLNGLIYSKKIREALQLPRHTREAA